MREKIFAEIGFGNENFFSTEIERGEDEKRIKGFSKPKKIKDYYFRLWVLKYVFIISLSEGFKLNKKNKNKFKILFGIEGTN